MAYSIVAAKPGGVDVLRKQEIDIPEPGPGEVLIRQTAIGVNFIDAYFRTGLYPWPVESDLVLGCEAAGVVEAVGADTGEFQPGDRVCYVVRNGAYATHRTIGAENLVRIPEGISDEVAAAAMLKGMTVCYLVNGSYSVREGDVVLFHAAAGGVGLIAGQWLRARGAPAIGTAGGPEKCALALENGYREVIDYRKVDFVERFRSFEPDGAHVVYDSVGNDTWRGSMKCLRNHGMFVCFGQSSGPITDFKLSDLAVGSFKATRPTLFHFTALSGWLENASSELFGLIADGSVKININQTFDLADAAAAHEALEGRGTTGCTVLIP